MLTTPIFEFRQLPSIPLLMGMESRHLGRDLDLIYKMLHRPRGRHDDGRRLRRKYNNIGNIYIYTTVIYALYILFCFLLLFYRIHGVS